MGETNFKIWNSNPSDGQIKRKGSKIAQNKVETCSNSSKDSVTPALHAVHDSEIEQFIILTLIQLKLEIQTKSLSATIHNCLRKKLFCQQSPLVQKCLVCNFIIVRFKLTEFIVKFRTLNKKLRNFFKMDSDF